jgi:hypothetical protein
VQLDRDDVLDVPDLVDRGQVLEVALLQMSTSRGCRDSASWGPVAAAIRLADLRLPAGVKSAGATLKPCM